MIDIETKVTNGNFLIIIVCNNKIIDKVFANESINKTYHLTGKYEIFIIGESASCEVNYKTEKN